MVLDWRPPLEASCGSPMGKLCVPQRSYIYCTLFLSCSLVYSRLFSCYVSCCFFVSPALKYGHGVCVTSSLRSSHIAHLVTGMHSQSVSHLNCYSYRESEMVVFWREGEARIHGLCVRNCRSCTAEPARAVGAIRRRTAFQNHFTLAAKGPACSSHTVTKPHM